MGFTPIFNASSLPLPAFSGTMPDVSGALLDYFQPMEFLHVVKSVVAFQNLETIITLQTSGVMFPVKQPLSIKKIGQRQWIFKDLYCLVNLQLNPDDIVEYLNKPYRVMQKDDFSLNGYLKYILQQDFQASVLTTQQGNPLTDQSGDQLTEQAGP